MSDGKVLVLGDDTRSFLAIVRSLGRKGIVVHCAPANFRAPALASRYVSAIHDIPPWIAGDGAWLEAMERLLRTEGFDLVIPCDETSLLPVQQARARLAPLARLAIPDDRSIAVLFDKHETRELARRLGVPVAPGRLLAPKDTAATIVGDLGTPVFVKPRHSYALGTLATRGAARVAKSEQALDAMLGHCRAGETLLEAGFPGDGVGISVLAHRGRICLAFEHHRAREEAGAAYYRVSAPLHPERAQACARIVAALDHTGLAMFEFRQNAGGDWILLEVNARPWGSMPLPVALGMDFPYHLYRLLTAGVEPQDAGYRPGVYGRNLLPDLRIIAMQAAAAKGIAGRAGFLARRAAEFPRLLTGREVHDVMVRDDPRPAFRESKELVAAIAERGLRGLPGAAALRRRRAERAITRALREAEQPHLVFVCRGNICRSPFAAALLAARLGDRRVSVASAGTMPQQGRATPPAGLLAARTFGIDLSSHRSAWLSPDVVGRATALIVFDRIISNSVLNRYPTLRIPVLLLSDLLGGGEIDDPVDGDFDRFCRNYGDIESAVAILLQILNRARPSGDAGAIGPYSAPRTIAPQLVPPAATDPEATRRRPLPEDAAVDRGRDGGTMLMISGQPETQAKLSRDGLAIRFGPAPDRTTLKRRWRALERHASPSFFTSWTWVGCRFEARFPNPYLLEIVEGGEVGGLALLNCRRTPLGFRSYHLGASGRSESDAIFVEHNGPLLGDVPSCTMSAALRHLLDAVDDGWIGSVIDCPGVGIDLRHAAETGGRVFDVVERSAPYRDLAALRSAGHDLPAALSANTRYQLRRSRRSYERSGPLCVEPAQSEAQATDFLRDLVRLHQARWRGRGRQGAFTDRTIRFHEDLIARGLPRGEVDLLRIAAGERLLGYLLNFVAGGIVHSYQSGFNYADAGPHEKPGLTSHHAAIQHYLGRPQLQRYDFLAGADRYKRSLSDGSVPLTWFRLTARTPSLAAAFYRARASAVRVRHRQSSDG